MKDKENVFRGNEKDDEEELDELEDARKRDFPDIIDLKKRHAPENTQPKKSKVKQMGNFKKDCTKLIMEGKMEDALQLILKSLESEDGNLYQTAIIQSSSLYEANRKMAQGLVTEDRDTMTRNRIKSALFYVLDEMEKEGIGYAQGDEPSSEENNGVMKILFLAANPADGAKLKIAEECRDIETVLKMAMDRDRFEMKSEWAVTTETLSQAILDEKPNIVHFSGHGEQDGILLQDRNGFSFLVKEDALSNLFSLFKDKIKCVILNSCYSKNQALAIAEHIPYVIGMKKAVPDRAAKSFAVGFYRALGAGKDIEFAYKFGINAVQLDGISGDDIPLLFRGLS